MRRHSGGPVPAAAPLRFKQIRFASLVENGTRVLVASRLADYPPCENALAEALNAGRLAGAGLDVVAMEPVRPENPLLSAKNCHVTPHIAWATLSARSRLMSAAAENLKAFLGGKPINQVGS